MRKTKKERKKESKKKKEKERNVLFPSQKEIVDMRKSVLQSEGLRVT